MAEAQACGKPLIAFGRGGAAEIVESHTGILFEDQSVECLVDALDRFGRRSFDPEAIRESSLKFSKDRFLREFSDIVANFG